MKRFLLASLAVAMLTSFATAQDDKPMIVVNGEPILRGNYIKRMEVLPGVGKQVGNQFITLQPGFITLQTLINEMLMLQLAKEKNVLPTEQQITDELNARIAENPDYSKAFTMLGFTQADLRYDLKVQLSEFNLVTMGINIADAQINRFYEDRKADFTLPKRYRLRVIAVNSDDLKKKVDAELASGKAFGAVAREHSVDVSTKFDDGKMGDIAEDSLGGEVKTLVTGLKAGQSTSWLKASTSELKLFVEAILPAEVIKLDDVLKRKIRRKLMVDRGAVRNDMGKMMAEMRAKARIEYQGSPFDDDIKQMMSGGN